MTKKKLLVTAMSMNIGGAEKSLVNLLNLLDYEEYDVDLLLFQRRGDFLPQIPAEVNVICVPEIDILYGMEPCSPISSAKKATLKAWRYLATGISRIAERQFDRRRLLRWQRFYSACIPNLLGHYDCAVSYSGGETFWYVVDKVDAVRKVTFFHSDYSNIDIDASKELRYLEKADRIATISPACAESLRRIFPTQAGKVCIAANPTCTDIVRKLSRKPISSGFDADESRLKIVSVGRLEEPKGFDLAALGAALAKQNLGPVFEWIVVGDGSEREKIESIVAEKGIADVFRLVGSKLNPYPYMAAADVLAQPSRYEGKSVVLDESRVLGLPVLATAYSSVHDQVRDGIDGMIVAMTPEGIAEGIGTLANGSSRLRALTHGAQTTDVSALEDISGFTALLVD